jgi:hypothetical protein
LSGMRYKLDAAEGHNAALEGQVGDLERQLASSVEGAVQSEGIDKENAALEARIAALEGELGAARGGGGEVVKVSDYRNR